MRTLTDTIVLAPKNDPESLLICQLCEALHIPLLVSAQPHGAMLGKEPNLHARLKEVYASSRALVVIEIPGPIEEAKLLAKGYDVHVIDHHRYDGLDRMKAQSSLEQFLAYFEITNVDLKGAGFEPVLVKGVGIIDRSFVWGLTLDICTLQDRARMIDYYLALSDVLDGGQRKRTEIIAKEALAHARTEGGFVIVKNPKPGSRIREALSFEIARQYPKPVATLLIDTDVIYVQEAPQAKALYDQFGGFMYGGEERCWGKKTDNHMVRQEIVRALGLDPQILLY